MLVKNASQNPVPNALTQPYVEFYELDRFRISKNIAKMLAVCLPDFNNAKS
jgi:hypothetical protein